MNLIVIIVIVIIGIVADLVITCLKL